MLPTRDQIERAAYDRWLRRDQAHGHDQVDWLAAENELTFVLNYASIAEFPLDSSHPLILGHGATRRCRLCERTSLHASFSTCRTVIQGAGETSLFSAEICDLCQADCRDPLAAHCLELWTRLEAGCDTPKVRPRELDLIAVMKSLVTSALLIMPASALDYFTDALEWVNNPEPDCDATLFAGAYIRIYQAPFLRERSWTGLARRFNDDAPLPYMLFFVAWRGNLLQIPVPLCTRDQDLDGRVVLMPERSITAGRGPAFAESRPFVLRVGSPSGPASHRARSS